MDAILVVEDNVDFREILCSILEGFGFKSIQTASVDEAIAILEQPETPQAILTDMHMPSKSGFDLLVAVRSNPTLALLPVVLTSNDRAACIVANSVGFDAAIDKGNLSGLGHALRYAIASRQALPNDLDHGAPRHLHVSVRRKP